MKEIGVRLLKIIKEMRNKFSLEYVIYLFFSGALLVSFFAMARSKTGHPIHYFAFLRNGYGEFIGLWLLLLLLTILFFSNTWKLTGVAKKMAFILLPAEILILTMIWGSKLVDMWLVLFSAVYAVIFSLYLIWLWHARRIGSKAAHENLGGWIKKQGWMRLTLVLVIIFINVFFGLRNIGKFAAVDEALWTFDRIPHFWKNIGEADWNGTRVSDKPGLTVAMISGLGLVFQDPMEFEKTYGQSSDPQATENLNRAFRIPLYIVMALLLPFFYFLVEKIAGRNAAMFAMIFIGLSPPLIGMARIINPDSILWVFTGIAILAYFAYLEGEKLAYLYLAGFFLGIALLTKYVANILFVYFFALIFLEYIVHKKAYAGIAVKDYFKQKLSELSILFFISIVTFYALYPAVWVKPQRILLATIQSQAFSSTWPLFAVILILMLIDIFLLRGKVLSVVLGFFEKQKRVVSSSVIIFFLGCLAFVFVNTYSGMSFFDFESILASPKSSYFSSGLWGVLLANFYPLVFGISPVALLLLIWASLRLLRKNKQFDRWAFYLIFFILLYYVGSSVNQVASPVRYQIMIFPLALIIAGLGVGALVDAYAIKVKQLYGLFLFLIAASAAVLYLNYPFYLSYASKLLPNQYYLDVKDMGSGSYEMANFLNSLPQPEKLTIWTDKSGVCNFFPGKCSSSMSNNELKAIKIDYIVISSGRESRTTKMIASRLESPLNYEMHLNDLYLGKVAPIFELKINGRDGQYVRVFKNNQE